MFPYQRFRAWQLAHQLVLQVYRVSDSWPSIARYELASQARRAAYSISFNLVEGSGRRGSREFRRFLGISLGSLSELSYCLLLARDLGYLGLDEWERMERLRDATGKVVWKLYDSLKERD